MRQSLLGSTALQGFPWCHVPRVPLSFVHANGLTEVSNAQRSAKGPSQALEHKVYKPTYDLGLQCQHLPFLYCFDSAVAKLSCGTHPQIAGFQLISCARAFCGHHSRARAEGRRAVAEPLIGSLCLLCLSTHSSWAEGKSHDRTRASQTRIYLL